MRTPLRKAKIEYKPSTSIHLLGSVAATSLVLTGLSSGNWRQFLWLEVAATIGGILGGLATLSGTIVSDSRFELDQELKPPSTADSDHKNPNL
jgi:hypothetical protein